MKNECYIVRDILPLYEEKLLSDETADFVLRHLNECSECREELAQMEKAVVLPKADTDITFLLKVKKTLIAKKVQTILLTVAILLAIAVSVIGFLTAPKYYPYSHELLDITEVDDLVLISFDEKITGYRLVQESAPDGEQKIYHIEAWSTIWDNVFGQRGQQFAVVKLNNADPTIIYYTQNFQGKSVDIGDVLVYGKPSSNIGGAISCPGLSLGYLLLFSGALFLVTLAVLVCLRKREKARFWLERIILFPIAYAIGHFCVLRFSTVSYSLVRDFFLIMLIALLIYCALLFALNIFNIKKEIRKMETHI